MKRTRALRKALRKDPKDLESAFDWGVLLLEMGSYEASEEKFRHIIESDASQLRARVFQGHANYALGQFGLAYESYRLAAAGGADVQPSLDAARGRIGELVRHDMQMPGLAGVVAAAIPDARVLARTLVDGFERVGDHPVELRAIDRMLLQRLAYSRGVPTELGGRFLVEYCVETHRGVFLSEEDRKSPGAWIPRVLERSGLAELVEVADTGDSLVLRRGSSESRDTADVSKVLEFLNRALESKSSNRRFALAEASLNRSAVLWISRTQLAKI
ncbi:MAG: hypothetical protein AAF517_06835 [Planctomycetota bacterium]